MGKDIINICEPEISHPDKSTQISQVRPERGSSLLSSLWGYFRWMIARGRIKSFLFIKTEPLETPFHFRDVPHLTGRGCTHCFLCMNACPVPGAIEIKKEGMPAVWNPRIHTGHCIRCGFCVEVCPEGTLNAGRIWQMTTKMATFLDIMIHIQINQGTCIGCGSCAVSCPINRQIDTVLAAQGASCSDEKIIRVEKGRCTIFHEDTCTGCKTCEESCSTRSIRIVRNMQACQVVYEEEADNSVPVKKNEVIPDSSPRE